MRYLPVSFVAVAVLSACTFGGGSTGGSTSSVSSAAASLHPLVWVETPKADETVSSPLTIKGQARGGWYFEASFPIRLLDADGNEIAVAPAQAQGDWMTEDFVPFLVTLTFTTPGTPTGTLVLEKDNPSGLPENDDSIEIPVQF